MLVAIQYDLWNLELSYSDRVTRMSKKTGTIMDLIRHGEPEGGSMYRGNALDHPLSDKGWKQMRKAVGDKAPWDAIYSSPMLRCSAFAEELAARHNLPMQILPELKEIGFGEWAGKTRDQLVAERPNEFHAFYSDPVSNTPPAAEPVSHFAIRISNALFPLAEQHHNQHILVVAHAGVIKAAITLVLQASPLSMYRMKIKNAGITRLRFNEEGARLENVNMQL